ncbi:MAG: 2-succinyl-5-enolpyruvyl-6-hydroxy-3-cyclohexene-1-carboxylic-acid synthase [Bacteroidota bacterium]|nr:2-succinyl-5-enolpyruvyl-6-hydroxy-3-cyclohexene-1-carboxylic-acid synthase [Bacteroidota bacterium]
MFSNKDNINILTALLVKWGVKDAVVCPGSRNAAIVHNLNECAEIDCYPVTDERSAGFFALGISQVADEPVVVCVTSGSALLNVAPAAAEAFYQHRKLIIISADRPISMIDQLQGQTIRQTGALDHVVRKTVTLPEPHDETEHWYCNRLVNEVLIEMTRGEGGPVHINVPISEPLFDFSVDQLPDERRITLHQVEPDVIDLHSIAFDFSQALRPMILIGQTKPENLVDSLDNLTALDDYGVLLAEQLAQIDAIIPKHIDEMLLSIEGEEEDYLPDFIVYMGDTFVSNRLKAFLRKTKGVRTVIVNRDGELHDVTMHATDIVQASIDDTLSELRMAIYEKHPTDYHDQWQALLKPLILHSESYRPDFSQMSAVRDLFVKTTNLDCQYQFANSQSIRLGLLYSDHYLYCNRGVNGIEGSLSTAVGFASACSEPLFCVIGDLSFFYDQNALWNENLTSNLRILLLNNGGGGIFSHLPGLKDSPALENLIIGAHGANARSICSGCGVHYLDAHNQEELEYGMEELAEQDSLTPILLEVFTDGDEDERVMRDFLFGNRKKLN